jgi:methionine sulfoxide reductase heme-binding subunit
MPGRKVIGTYLAVLAVTVLLAAVLLSVARTPPLYTVARGAGLVGYQFVALAVISSAFMRPLVRLYRKPFVTLHHWISVTGLVLLIIHPLLLAYLNNNLGIFVTAFTVTAWQDFFRFGGAPALYLLLIGSLAATRRLREGNRFWRYIHWLNYVALIIGTAHAVMLGTSVAATPWVRWIAYLMAAAAVVVYLVKRLVQKPPARRSRTET